MGLKETFVEKLFDVGKCFGLKNICIKKDFEKGGYQIRKWSPMQPVTGFWMGVDVSDRFRLRVDVSMTKAGIYSKPNSGH